MFLGFVLPQEKMTKDEARDFLKVADGDFLEWIKKQNKRAKEFDKIENEC